MFNPDEFIAEDNTSGFNPDEFIDATPQKRTFADIKKDRLGDVRASDTAPQAQATEVDQEPRKLTPKQPLQRQYQHRKKRTQSQPQEKPPRRLQQSHSLCVKIRQTLV